eukprot:jgi/Botrbrau1/18820/Bobra.0841s0001.1
MKEVGFLKNCRNSNVVQFQGVCLHKASAWLVMEYMPGGDLQSFLAQQKDWTWCHRAAVLARDIARGMAYLHSQRVIHMDLKSRNVLLSSDGHAKIADVGMAHLLTESRTHGSNLEMGTFAYVAPEVILEGKAGHSADVYCFGVILWELATGKVPVRGEVSDVRWPQDCPEEVARLVVQCLSASPSDRPTARDLAIQLQGVAAGTSVYKS